MLKVNEHQVMAKREKLDVTGSYRVSVPVDSVLGEYTI